MSRKTNLISLTNWQLIWSVAICVLFVVNTNAQQLTARPDRGFGGSGGYQTTNIDSVSLQNGGLNVNIPLASLPPMAGGKLSFTLTASYNSKLWDIHRMQAEGSTQTPGCQPRYSTQEVWPAENGAGWQIGGRYDIFFRDAHNDYDYLPPVSFDCDGYDFYFMQHMFFKPMLRTPDGAEHELRIDGSYSTYSSQGFHDHLKQYYIQDTGTPNFPTFSSAIRLYTVDGSFITAIYRPESDSNRWTIYMKDGTRVEQYSDGQQRTIDSNGNSILDGSRTVNGIYERFVQDEQTGREIKWTSITYNSQPATKVEYQSTGGAWQQTIVVWGTTTVTGKAYTNKSWNPTGGELGDGDACVMRQLVQTGFNVIREIILPQTEQGTSDKKFSFSYNSDTTVQTTTPGQYYCGWEYQNYTRNASVGWGELSRITTPSGAQIDYHYTNDGVHDFLSDWIDDTETVDGIVRNGVTSKVVTHDGTTETWTYTGGSSVVTAGSVTNPDGSVYSELYNPVNTAYSTSTGDGAAGKLIRSVTNGVLTERHWTSLGGQIPAFGLNNQYVQVNPVVDTEYTTLLAADGTTRLKMSAKKFSYDYNGEMTQTIEYDWFDPSSVTWVNPESYSMPAGVPSGAQVLRVTNNSYYNTASSASSSTAYHKRSLGSPTVILGKPKESTVGTSSTVKSDTKFSYDGQSWGTAPTVGNLTKTSVYNDVTSTWIDATVTYTTQGNIQSTTDPNGNVTQYTYGSIGGYTDLYPTQVVQAYGTSIARTSSTVYDFSTGLPTSVTDNDNSLTNATEYDILLRPTKVITASGTSLESWTTTEYHDHDRFVVVKSDVATKGDGSKVATQFFDQLGRVRLAKTLEDASTQSATNETDGIKVETRYLNDYNSSTGVGHSYQLTSNPFRASTSSAASSEPTMGWTLSTALNTGRHSEVQTFSGAGLPTVFGGSNTSSTGIVTTDIDADRMLVTDQAGKQRISKSNALGQLIDAWEVVPSSDGSTVSVTFPNTSIAYGYQTSYAYDVLNNLTTVTQGSQTRTFSYSSVARLLTAANPESGTISYAYDSNGNLTGKTDARSITTSYTYDALNRVTFRDYSDSTPDVTYTYDNKTYAKGKLTKVSSSVSTTEYTSFDLLGRVTGHKQTTDSTDYTTSYTYKLTGAIDEETYPSGRKVRNTYAVNGDLSQLETQPYGGSYATRASNFTYNPAGAVSTLQLGNGKYETTIFNSRLQPTQIGLGTSTSDTSLLRVSFDYGTTDNNGNVKNQTITVPSMSYPLIQTYAYDSLNRLQSAEEKSNGTTTWKQTFLYDRYGNRNLDSANTTTLGSCSASVCNPTISTSNNRFSSGQGWSYDSAGNTTVDANSKQFTYDAENKQTLVKDASNVTIGTYYYDGNGRRVKKTSGSDSVIFVYDAAGRLVEEYPTSSPTSVATAYVYASSRLLTTETATGTNYLTSDHLGSARMNTDATGSVTARHDYMPFGEEITTSQRTSGLGYQPDSVRKQFTGYERDNESGLDFAEARYFHSTLGRFSSPDDFLKDTKTAEPSSWNLYVYVRNNPLKLVDTNGQSVDGSNLSDEERKRLISEFARITGYRVEDLSFGANGLLTIASGAKSSGGSAMARRLLNEAITTSWEFVLVSVNSTDVAFAEHEPTLKPSIVRPDGTRVSGGTYGRVKIDFADFNNAVFENDAARESYSLGLIVLHEFVHGLYQNLDDHAGGGAGEIENTWINPIRQELGLATRDQYGASIVTFRNQGGDFVRGPELSFTRYEYGPLQQPTFKNPFPEEGTHPVVTHVDWQLQTVGGKIRTN